MIAAIQREGAILVTGITGLIGAELAHRLVREGHRVIGMDRIVPQGMPFPIMTHDLPDPHRWHEAIVRHDVRKVVHAGGISGPMLMRDAPARLCDINLSSLVDLLEAARIHQVERVIWFSSVMAYGERADILPVNEDTPLYPSTVYGATKAAGEALINAYFAEHGVDAVALRVASCYGPGRTTSCLIRTLVQDAIDGRVTSVRDEPGRTRQHIYVDDVIDGICSALSMPALRQRAYNIGPGVAQTLDDIVAQVRLAVPEVSVRVQPDGMGWNTFGLGPLTIDAARRDLDFDPKVSLADGAARVRDAILRARAPAGS
ncbi:NAD-dependent epimerase/dehydratase family protein [Castellaniella sp. S9]|uniref:NAD-dependent epimerase/dehydratase family protein n=1 Tax=Castellaniella sp. S9 TaxID=2993652 RepID=UPI0022B51F6A|nr:NAD(P)-dependent oxidoreductase [Castellaniella sp. S9]